MNIHTIQPSANLKGIPFPGNYRIDNRILPYLTIGFNEDYRNSTEISTKTTRTTEILYQENTYRFYNLNLKKNLRRKNFPKKDILRKN